MLKSPSLYASDLSTENHTLQPSYSPAYGEQTMARKEAGPGARWRQLWQRIMQTPPWSVLVAETQQGISIELHHASRGLIRIWQGAHAKLLIQHPCTQHLFRMHKARALEKHQVSQMLMTAAATELMLRRLAEKWPAR